MAYPLNHNNEDIFTFDRSCQIVHSLSAFSTSFPLPIHSSSRSPISPTASHVICPSPHPPVPRPPDSRPLLPHPPLFTFARSPSASLPIRPSPLQHKPITVACFALTSN
ncbi:hypothetical protein BsWGS_01589 [Bradybaena similaris]